MGRREAESRGAMNTGDRSELGCLQDAASSGHRAGGESPRLGSRRPCNADNRQRNPEDAEAAGRAPTAAAPMEVKKHQHKHNLKHRYEVMETLGKGTYGKVKKAVERASLKTVSNVLLNMMQKY
ncbi:NUAK family SNF1-like kinase 1 [Lates japonicus]|uniref:NUAK family SNF1-like kinase 1 n=1 Tax=Lates japonicus TaxID=270547 RepID=A0AAD3M2I4_LATJO|nr:NUAK family SNF1-like kinase 1 [Lates japonicus]